MPTQLYRCLHVPIKTAGVLARNPLAAGVGAVVAVIVMVQIGVWVMLGIFAAMFGGLLFLINLQIKGGHPASLGNLRVIQMKTEELPMCIGNHGVRATTIFRVITDGGIREIPVCDEHVTQTTNFFARNRLTAS